MNKEKLWTKEFLTVSTISFLLTITFFLLLVTIAPYAQTEYGATTSTAGLVSSIFIIGSLIGRLGTGRLMDHIGSKRMLWIGLISISVISLLYFFAFNLGLLLVIRLLYGIAAGIATTAASTIIAQILPESRKGEGIGYFSLSVILGTALGPFIGILLLNLGNGYQWIFASSLAVGIICLIMNMLIKINVPTSNSYTKSETKGSLVSKFIEPNAIPISLIALVIGFSCSGIFSFLTFYTEEINLVSAASYFFLVYAIVIIFSRPFTGKLMDAKGANIVSYPCFVIFGFGMLLFSQSTAGWMLLLSAAFIGLGFGNFNSVAQAVAVKVTPPHRVGLATSTYFILFDLGLGVSPYLLGFLVPTTGYRSVFSWMTVVILCCIPMYYWLHGRKDRELLKPNVQNS